MLAPSAVADLLAAVDALSDGQQEHLERILAARLARRGRADLRRRRWEALDRLIASGKPAVTERHFAQLVADLCLIDPDLARGRSRTDPATGERTDTLSARCLRRAYLARRRRQTADERHASPHLPQKRTDSAESGRISALPPPHRRGRKGRVKGTAAQEDTPCTTAKPPARARAASAPSASWPTTSTG